ncbi:TetR/AcrR family transcriptional regulator [Microterricola viridarii]|uniref:DNA-binding transcriptional regulator, AcrR family n=1 Tax=Microterricola viridarii TaxID=412690 RepID=A0A1H1YSZ8_9MICO|nr:TetR/AcrR family transcriptional regulator [Microterricola viridarii]SDT24186.1 DNA-binding transcriptional regulator, AcrR family [Microterricola viridarii]
MSEPLPRGRPRSEQSRRATLEATRELLHTVGYDRLTIEAIASAAGVSRQTVYRWWRAKSAIVAEAVLDGVIILPGADAAGGSIPGILNAMGASLGSAENAGLIRALAAAAADDPAASHALYERMTGPTHAALARSIAEGVARGALRADIDAEVAADALIGAVLYRVLTRQDSPPGYGDDLAATVLGAPPA